MSDRTISAQPVQCYQITLKDGSTRLMREASQWNGITELRCDVGSRLLVLKEEVTMQVLHEVLGNPVRMRVVMASTDLADQLVVSGIEFVKP